MPSVLWVLEPGLSREGVGTVLSALAEKGIRASVRDLPAGKVVVIDDPPAGLRPPEGVLRAATVEVPSAGAVTRRAFLDNFATALSLAALGGAAGVAALYSAPPPLDLRDDVEEVEVGTLAEVKARGSKRFRLGREPAIVVHHGDRLFALSTVCSHLGCLVRWSPDRGQLACPCHQATFDLEGNVLEGPPPRPLRSFEVSLQDDRVLVRRRTAP